MTVLRGVRVQDRLRVAAEHQCQRVGVVFIAQRPGLKHVRGILGKAHHLQSQRIGILALAQGDRIHDQHSAVGNTDVSGIRAAVLGGDFQCVRAKDTGAMRCG